MRLNPCGMGVDFLRTCHRVNARMIEGSETTSPIRWFFAEPGAKLLPFPSAFGSNVWEYEERVMVGAGETDRVRSFDGGRNRGYPGLSFQGEPTWFLNGIPAAELLSPVPLTLCGTPTQSSTAGVEAGGQAGFMDSGLVATGGTEADGAAGFMDSSLDASGGVEDDGAATFEVPPFNASGGVEADGVSGMETGDNGVDDAP